MNPKYPANLDPKLREAYDRVMGTGDTTSSTPNPQPQHHEPPKSPVKMVTEPVKHEEKDSDSTVVHFSADTHKHKKAEEKPEPKEATRPEANAEGKSQATPILLGIIGVLFFLGYALFWAQIFGFNLLPSL